MEPIPWPVILVKKPWLGLCFAVTFAAELFACFGLLVLLAANEVRNPPPVLFVLEGTTLWLCIFALLWFLFRKLCPEIEAEQRVPKN